ncbi:hypothetical protein [Flavobacterium sp. TSSA_36]|uniref:hypothetical protein n=1 Tax=Flavobacterium sp. TSSA_36 TaxID=3447669 RepID=UPI003F35D996
MTKEEEIEIVHGRGTHVVILGAGASYASTLKTPEKNGKRLPLMKNIVDIVGLNDVVNNLPKEYQILKEDFEKLYCKISKLSEFEEEKIVIEKAVYSYFNELDLPDEPTIYDYLILSLRHRKDIIATFNWDPFLYKAYVRNSEFIDSPGILFLHGCVSIGFDKSTGWSGPAGWYSKKTQQLFEPTKLLYPVESKDYNSDDFIKGQWGALSEKLKIAERVTIFGYSAPVSDVEAIDLLQKAWGNVEQRTMEEFELIDVRKEDEVRKSWDIFIHSHHYHYATNYFDSSLALHPRRTVESYHHWALPMSPNEAFQDGNQIPDNFTSLEQLWDWHRPLVEAEKKFYNE